MNGRLMTKNVNSVSAVLFAYMALMNIIAVILCFLDLAVFLFQSQTLDVQALTDRMLTFLTENAWSYLISIGIGGLILWKWQGNQFWKEQVFQKEKSMTLGAFAQILCLFIMPQYILTGYTVGLEWLLNQIGFSAMKVMETIDVDVSGFSMFLYVGFIGPLAEELIFRGFVLRKLEPLGKKWAILLSAFTFGLFHGNIIQLPFAFLVGLILGNVALEYHIGWAIVLHIINNFGLSIVLTKITETMPAGIADGLMNGLFIGATVVSAVILVLRRKEIAAYFRGIKTPAGAGKAVAKAPLFWIFTAAMLFTAIFTIQPL